MLYYANHRRTAGEEASLGVRYARLDTLVAESDVICLALPLMDGSQALFGPERLRAMKPGAWLVNTARGAIVDRDALVEAIDSGHLAGYAGDTWYPQPAPADHPWRALPLKSEAMTIHYSGMTREAQDRITEGVLEMLHRPPGGSTRCPKTSSSSTQRPEAGARHSGVRGRRVDAADRRRRGSAGDRLGSG